jgi:hypothetical protein
LPPDVWVDARRARHTVTTAHDVEQHHVRRVGGVETMSRVSHATPSIGLQGRRKGSVTVVSMKVRFG